MGKKIGLLVLASLILLSLHLAHAQQPTKIPRIGYLGAASTSAIAARIEGFRHGLRELGYIEGKNVFVEWPSAEGKPDRLPRSRLSWYVSR